MHIFNFNISDIGSEMLPSACYAHFCSDKHSRQLIRNPRKFRITRYFLNTPRTILYYKRSKDIKKKIANYDFIIVMLFESHHVQILLIFAAVSIICLSEIISE